jgi:hypothetical protein
MTRVSPGHGLDWIVAGWSYLARNTRPLVLLTALLLGATLLVLVMSTLRYASLLFSLLIVPYLAILAHSCRHLDDGETAPSLRDCLPLARSTPLWLLAAISATLTLSLDLLSNSMALYARAGAWSALGLYFLSVKALSLLALMALWLAPALVLQGAGPLTAMRRSLRASLNNILPWLLFFLLAFVLAIVAAIPLGLGLLAALPTLGCGAYLASRDIFS